MYIVINWITTMSYLNLALSSTRRLSILTDILSQYGITLQNQDEDCVYEC